MTDGSHSGDAAPCRTQAAFVSANALDPQISYKAALIYHVQATLAHTVSELRIEFAKILAIPSQPPPHLTLLYLGHLSGTELIRLAPRLVSAVPKRITACVGGLGVFTRGGRIINLHISVKPNDALIRAHTAAVVHFASAGFALQTRYYGVLFRPHISILDSIAAKPGEAAFAPQMGFVRRMIDLSAPEFLVRQSAEAGLMESSPQPSP